MPCRLVLWVPQGPQEVLVAAVEEVSDLLMAYARCLCHLTGLPLAEVLVSAAATPQALASVVKR